MNWQEAVGNQHLRDLPFKIELNEFGQAVMTNRKIIQSVFSGQISFLLSAMRKDGETLISCAIKTRKGTKVADVAWASMEVINKIENETDASVAPEICVEVLSMSNSDREVKLPPPEAVAL